MDSMFRGSRAPWSRSEDRCDGAGSEADGAIPPVKPGPMLPVLGVLVFEEQSGCQCRDKTPAILPVLATRAAVSLGGDAVGTLQ